jgi:uncharacterized protein
MLATSKIILGTVQFGLEYGINNNSGKPNQEAVCAILDLAYENKVRLLDTAEAYGNAQEIIGAYHKQSKNKFDVITKFSSKRNDLSSTLAERIYQDLQTLNISSLYCYMYHSLTDFRTYYDKHKEDIKILKESGIIDKLGVSVYTDAEMDEVLSKKDLDLIQLPFNLLDNNSRRSDSIRKAKDIGIEIHTRSVFLQGLFFKDLDQLPVKLKDLKPALSKIKDIAERNHLSLTELALNYVIQQPNIDKVLIGVDSTGHLSQDIGSMGNKISLQVLKEIDSINIEHTDMLNPSNWNN